MPSNLVEIRPKQITVAKLISALEQTSVIELLPALKQVPQTGLPPAPQIHSTSSSVLVDPVPLPLPGPYTGKDSAPKNPPHILAPSPVVYIKAGLQRLLEICMCQRIF